MNGPDVGASVRARLLTIAKADGQDFNFVLTRYALERLLYRLGQSRYAERFLLKGALLFDLCFDIPHRPTRDIDLLGFGSAEPLIAERIFRELCSAVAVPGAVPAAAFSRASDAGCAVGTALDRPLVSGCWLAVKPGLSRLL